MKTLQTSENAEWKTVSENLVRYVPSGTYYARIRVNGKLHKKSLKTDRVSVARLRLSDLEKELREQASCTDALVRGKMTFGDAAEIYDQQLSARIGIKESTKKYYRENLLALRKSWSGLADADVAKITENGCQE